MSSAMSRIHPPSRPTAGSSSTSAATRSGRAAARFSATAPPNECPTTTTGPSASASSRSASAPTLASMRPRRRPRRPAVSDQVRCDDREVGQVPRRQRLPAPAVPGQAVDGQDLGRPGRSVAMHMQQIGHGLDAASSRQRPLVGPPWCHAFMSAPHTELTPTALTEPGMRGVVRVLGGAGTGKSSLLIQTAAAHIAAGSDPESVLLLTGSARLGSQARAAITSALLSAGSRAVVREPLVRTVHSYAFAVLRLAAQRNGDPPPRLITSAEQDGIIRELLAGDLEDGDASPVAWPAQLRPALSTVGFANELRDLLARCTERGVDPVALQRIGRRQRPTRMVGRRPVRAGLRADHAAALRGRHGGAAGHRARAGRRRTRRCRARSVRDRPGPAGRRAQHGSSCFSSTTRSTSTRRPRGWYACCRPAPS